jgi:hypothetical protein
LAADGLGVCVLPIRHTVEGHATASCAGDPRTQMIIATASKTSSRLKTSFTVRLGRTSRAPRSARRAGGPR